MGESAERMAKENGISREAQDRWALRSHQLAAQGTADGRLTAEIVPTFVPPATTTSSRPGQRHPDDTSEEKLAR
jgi:acetyl-CoA acyltransferase